MTGAMTPPDAPAFVPFQRVALIGLGLIAGSMAHAMRQGGLARHVAGHARSAETRAVALQIGLVDSVHDSAAEAVAGADLVVLAVPVGAMAEVAAAIAPHLEPGAILTDVGSVKQAVIDAVGPHVPAGVHFIPGHPLAGTEHSGPRSGFATLFQNRWWLLTPLPDSDPAAVGRLSALVRAMGASVETMDAPHHDLVLAVTSHVPHLIAYTMVGVADHLRRVTESEVIRYSAAGFRDFTRIAASDPTMWRDVFLHNKDATLDILGRFAEELFVLQRAIRMGDGEHLHKYFTGTRAIRRGIIEAGQDTAAPDFGRAPAARTTDAGTSDAGTGGAGKGGAATGGAAMTDARTDSAATGGAAMTDARTTDARTTDAGTGGAGSAG